MNRILTLAAAGLLGLGVGSAAMAGISAEVAGGPLVVHEWGTFTNFAGSDGVQRKFTSEVGIGASLPGFVVTYQDDGPSGGQQPIYTSKSELVCSQRMETPVIYIYPGCRGPVDIEAKLLDGTMTEFYPPVNGMDGGKGESGKPGKTDRSVVRWQNVRYDADPDPNAQPVLPRDEYNKDSHYYRARATDACVLTVDAMGKPHHEKFLFYRGAANFESKIKLRALGNDKFEVSNTTGEPIAAAYMIRIDKGQVRFTPVSNIGEKGAITLGEQKSDIETLATALRASLVSAGLFEKEAAAMVATWRDQWFGENGTRLLYIMPSAEVNRVLTLNIKPKPDQLARVFVGRSDVMTPEDEAAIVAAVNAQEKPGADVEKVWKSTPDFGRFRSAAMQRVQELRIAAQQTAAAKPAEVGLKK